MKEVIILLLGLMFLVVYSKNSLVTNEHNNNEKEYEKGYKYGYSIGLKEGKVKIEDIDAMVKSILRTYFAMHLNELKPEPEFYALF